MRRFLRRTQSSIILILFSRAVQAGILSPSDATFSSKKSHLASRSVISLFENSKLRYSSTFSLVTCAISFFKLSNIVVTKGLMVAKFVENKSSIDALSIMLIAQMHDNATAQTEVNALWYTLAVRGADTHTTTLLGGSTQLNQSKLH